MSDICPACGAALKIGMLSSNQLLTPAQVTVLDLSGHGERGVACNKCGDALYQDARLSLQQEAVQLKTQLAAMIPYIPIVSLQQPMGWTYEPITVITAQTVTGTGVFSDVTSAFTDLFGTQSGTYNAKLRDGENLCKASLRAQAIEFGGNAVLAIDIDYAEVGGQRAMLMVCMTGTVVRITHSEPPDPEFFQKTDGGQTLTRRARLIEVALKASN